MVNNVLLDHLLGVDTWRMLIQHVKVVQTYYGNYQPLKMNTTKDKETAENWKMFDRLRSGHYTEDIAEKLSSISQSSQAFKQTMNLSHKSSKQYVSAE